MASQKKVKVCMIYLFILGPSLDQTVDEASLPKGLYRGQKGNFHVLWEKKIISYNDGYRLSEDEAKKVGITTQKHTEKALLGLCQELANHPWPCAFGNLFGTT